MEIDIVKIAETPLLSRKRVTAWASYTGATPPRPVLRKELAKKAKAKENLVVVRHIYTRFGEQRAKLIAHIYEDEKIMLTLEGKKLVEKHSAPAKGAADGEQPAGKKQESAEGEPAEKQKEPLEGQAEPAEEQEPAKKQPDSADGEPTPDKKEQDSEDKKPKLANKAESGDKQADKPESKEPKSKEEAADGKEEEKTQENEQDKQ